MAVVSLSAGVGGPDLLLGLEDGLEDGLEPDFDVEVTSVVDDEGTTCDGIAKFPDIPIGKPDRGPV
jgi:hypothetical protein